MTNIEIRELQPQAIWRNFANLNEVPRPSKDEARVIAFMKAFGEGLGLETFVDEVGNVIVEALFTIDEETGMTGAMGLKGGILKGDILINLDTEEDDEIGVGCAGGVDITATRSYSFEEVEEGKTGYLLIVNGLQGGHSR